MELRIEGETTFTVNTAALVGVEAGDRITVAGSSYTVVSVDSDTCLTVRRYSWFRRLWDRLTLNVRLARMAISGFWRRLRARIWSYGLEDIFGFIGHLIVWAMLGVAAFAAWHSFHQEPQCLNGHWERRQIGNETLGAEIQYCVRER